MAKGSEASLLLKIKTLGQEALDRIVITFGDIKEVVGQVMEIFSASINAYKEQERAVNGLNQAMINAGTFSAALQNEYLEQAAALQKITLFTDDQINSAQALLQTAIGSRKVTEGLTKATLDLAQAKGMDLASAASLVGKAIAGEADVFKRYGIEVDVAASKGDKLTAVVEALNGKFGGQAEAARQGTGGIDGFKMSADELSEAIGSRLAPAVARLAEGLIPIIDKITSWIDAGNLAKKSVNELGHAIVEQQNHLMKLMEMQSKTKDPFLAKDIEYATQRLGELNEAFNKQINDEQTALDNKAVNDAARRQKEAAAKQADMVKDMEVKMQMDQIQADMLYAQTEGNALKLAELELKQLQMRFKNEEDFHKKKKIAAEIANKQEVVSGLKIDQIKEKDRQDFYKKMEGLQSSNNQALSIAGKAFALRQIAIDTPVAITKALSAFPPPFNFAAAALVGAAAADQAARVSGVALAEGGVVKRRPGGIQATIGEGDSDEAVIPLDKAGDFGLGGGGGNTFVFNNPIFLGDKSSAQDFIQEVDKLYLELRQNGGSVAFDGTR
jgi:hypothetical protein